MCVGIYIHVHVDVYLHYRNTHLHTYLYVYLYGEREGSYMLIVCISTYIIYSNINIKRMMIFLRWKFKIWSLSFLSWKEPCMQCRCDARRINFQPRLTRQGCNISGEGIVWSNPFTAPKGKRTFTYSLLLLLLLTLREANADCLQVLVERQLPVAIWGLQVVPEQNFHLGL